jgi:photosystem II stability/assembly factor-like uncharacterized protein
MHRWFGPFLAILVFATGAARALEPQPTPTPEPLAQLQWRSIGPAVSGGRLAAVAGTDADPYLYYVGAAGGGVWKSTNAGQSWLPVFDAESTMSIGAIAIARTDKNVVWVGTGEANPRNDVTQGDGVYRSIDGGKTWTRTLALHNALVSAVSIDPRDAKNVVVGVLGDAFSDDEDRGIYRTIDGGASWTKTLYLGPNIGASDVVRAEKSPNVLYAGMWQYRRTGWSLQSGGTTDGLYRSSDGGATWMRLGGHGLPTDTLGRVGVAVAPSDPNRVYAILQSKQGLLWRSDDGGASWVMTSSNTLIDQRPFYFNHVFVDPTDENHVWSVSVHLTVSTDGGKTFATTGRGAHGDHHAMWIAADGKRIIEGNDGGVAFSRDGGDTWTWRNVLPISQLYHVGLSREDPYRVCAPLQDNGTYCAPSNPLSERGVGASQWLVTGGGDGTWVVFDPLDPSLVWESFGGGNFGGDLYIHDFRTAQTRSIAPYTRDQNVVDPRLLKYRINWEMPIAFDPFDGHMAYVGANVVFASRDRGAHWNVVSTDLTRNEKSHQIVTGDITLDGTGAETSDTILDIAPSARARGEIWIGTDDGLVQLTRDGGRRWHNVTPPLARTLAWGRFPSIAPSLRDAAIAYAVYDRHMVGDRAPYVFVTRDFGQHWASLASGLPAGAEMRSIAEDPRNADLLYLGTENALYLSWDRGAHWRAAPGKLPPVSMRDVRVQPDANDVVVATHGRGIYILDDATPLQHLSEARSAGLFLFKVRLATLWQLHAYWNTPTDGSAPPYGAILSFYQGAPSKTAPSAEIVDAGGRVVRRFHSHDEHGKQVPDLTNQAGVNRFTWDLSEDPPVSWASAPVWNQGYDDGAQVVPGTYTLRLHVGGRTLQTPVVVRADPRMHYVRGDAQARNTAVRGLFADFDRVDRALNLLSTIAGEAPVRTKAANAAANTALAEAVTHATQSANELLTSMTSNPANDQDNDFLTDVLRERLQTEIDTYGDSFAPPNAEQLRETAVLRELTNARIAAFDNYVKGELARVNAELSAAHLAPLDRR